VQTVRKLLIKNKRVFQPDHVSYTMSTMSVTLKRFAGLHGFFTKLSSIAGYGPHGFAITDEHRQAVVDVFAAWPRLARLNYNDQPLDVPGSFGALFTPIISPLTKLSLVRAQVSHSLTHSISQILPFVLLRRRRLFFLPPRAQEKLPPSLPSCLLLSSSPSFSSPPFRSRPPKYR